MTPYITDYINQIESWAEKCGFGLRSTRGNIHTSHTVVPDDTREIIVDLMARLEYPEQIFYEVVFSTFGSGVNETGWINIKFVEFGKDYKDKGLEEDITIFVDKNGIESLTASMDFYNRNVGNLKVRNIINEARKFLSGDLSPDERRSYIELPECARRRGDKPFQASDEFRIRY